MSLISSKEISYPKINNNQTFVIDTWILKKIGFLKKIKYYS